MSKTRVHTLGELVEAAEEASPEDWGDFRVVVKLDGGVWEWVRHTVTYAEPDIESGNVTLYLGDELP